MSSIDEIAEEYVARAAELDPVMATSTGIAGYDDRMTELSPAGFAARAELDRATVTAAGAAVAADERERVAKAAMLERLGLDVERYDAGDITSDLNAVASQLQNVRMIFDLMPTGGEEAQHNIAARMAAVPDAYAGLRRSYAEAARRGRVPRLAPGGRHPQRRALPGPRCRVGPGAHRAVRAPGPPGPG